MIKNLLSIPFIVTTMELMIILITVASVFLVLILIAIVKMFKLKAENKKLMETNAFKDYEDSSKDIPSGHLYGDN